MEDKLHGQRRWVRCKKKLRRFRSIYVLCALFLLITHQSRNGGRLLRKSTFKSVTQSASAERVRQRRHELCGRFQGSMGSDNISLLRYAGLKKKGFDR